MVRTPGALVIAALILPTGGSAQDTALSCPRPFADSGQCEPAPLSPGQIVFIDPETGEVLTGDAAAEAALEDENSAFVEAVTDQVAEAFNTEGLTEERTETGAVALDLEGRFQSPLVAKVEVDGGITAEHFGPAPQQDQ